MKLYIISLLFIPILFGCTSNIKPPIISNANATSAIFSKQTITLVPESIFVITDSFKTQNNKDFVLSSLYGKPTVVAMIFTNCGYACPRLTSDMNRIAEKLKDQRNKINFVLVSFDSERDSSVQLKNFQKKMGLDEEWILLHSNEQTIRTLSVLLNVQFEKDAEGNFSHSNIISVLNKQGKLSFQKEGIDSDSKETIKRIKNLLDDCCNNDKVILANKK